MTSTNTNGKPIDERSLLDRLRDLVDAERTFKIVAAFVGGISLLPSIADFLHLRQLLDKLPQAAQFITEDIFKTLGAIVAAALVAFLVARK